MGSPVIPPDPFEPAEPCSQRAQELLRVIRDELLPDLPADFPLDGDLFAAGLDSMGIMQLVLILEERFAFSAEPSDLSRRNFASASGLAALLQSRNCPEQ